jgi:hypothetical protein
MEHIISKIQYYIMHINFMTMISYGISLLSFFKKRIIIIKLQMVYVCQWLATGQWFSPGTFQSISQNCQSCF